jgi:hypothetical protein
MTNPALDCGPSNNKNLSLDRFLGLLGETLPQLFRSDLIGSIARHELKNVLETSSNSAPLVSMRGRRIVIVDDSQSVLSQALPLLMGATGGSASAIWVKEAGLGEEVYAQLTAHRLAEMILVSQPEWVLMDADLGCGLLGTDVVDKLRELSPNLPCLGFSSRPAIFNGSPVIDSILKRERQMFTCIESVALTIARHESSIKSNDVSLLSNLATPPARP